jgi:tetratricopeptide (TPR) repeat protein
VTVRVWPLLLVLGSALGCVASAADHEGLGDAAYRGGDYATALQEYEAVPKDHRNAGLWAKLGAAALGASQYHDAAEAYEHLAAADGNRKSEAARGLVQVAQAADHDDNSAALEDVVEALRRLAPERVSQKYTLALVRGGRLGQAEAAGLGPLALAAAGDASTVDQMLVQYGAALQGTTACADAVPVYQTALRRARDPALRRRAADGLAACSVQLGQEALDVGHPDVAAGWFARVTRDDTTSVRGRRALLGLGDARVAQGDLLGATFAYQSAMNAPPDDSIAGVAASRLARLGASAATADSP